jgi:uncharacterized protein YcfJ
MKRTLIKGIVAGLAAGTLLAAAATAFADSRYADVINVKPLRENVATRSREECRDVEVTERGESRDKNQVAGTVAGAVVGGVLGHQVGGGSGKDIATVAGAAAGGYAGNRIQKNSQDRDRVVTKRECRTVDRDRDRDRDRSEVTAYEVTYRLDGRTDKVVMDHRPGDRIRVDKGRWVED